MAHTDTAAWRKSTYSGGGNCVEVGGAARMAIAVRDSQSPATPALAFGRDQWDAFTGKIRNVTVGASLGPSTPIVPAGLS